MKVITRFLVCGLLTGVLLGKELPAEILQQLTAETLRERTAAQQQLLEWGRKRPEVAIESYFQHYFSEVSPEAKARLRTVLQVLVIENHYREPGFVGVQMRGDELQVEEKIYRVVEVTSVLEKTAAERHGIQPGDEIWKVDGRLFDHTALPEKQFVQLVQSKKKGDEIKLSIWRKGEWLELKLMLGERVGALSAIAQKQREEFFETWLKEKAQKKRK